MTWTGETHGGNKASHIKDYLCMNNHTKTRKKTSFLRKNKVLSIIMMISTSFSFLFAYSTTENVQGNVYRDIETLFGKALALNNQWIS